MWIAVLSRNQRDATQAEKAGRGHSLQWGHLSHAARVHNNSYEYHGPHMTLCGPHDIRNVMATHKHAHAQHHAQHTHTIHTHDMAHTQQHGTHRQIHTDTDAHRQIHTPHTRTHAHTHAAAKSPRARVCSAIPTTRTGRQRNRARHCRQPRHLRNKRDAVWVHIQGCSSLQCGTINILPSLFPRSCGPLLDLPNAAKLMKCSHNGKSTSFP